VGNGYADVYSSAIDPKLVGAPRAALPKILQMQRVFANSSLPGWLSDTILNSIGHARSAWWDKDGRFFQWEAFDCTYDGRYGPPLLCSAPRIISVNYVFPPVDLSRITTCLPWDSPLHAAVVVELIRLCC
jgi:hypothetical protein